jgi:hypothetical protein
MEKYEPPKGALLLTVLFLLLTAVLWTNIYLTLIQRGGIPQP